MGIRRAAWTAAPAVCIAALMGAVFVWGSQPVQNAHFGDDQEYLTMAMSFIRHRDAAFQPGDDTEMLRSLPRKWRKTLTKKFSEGKPPYAYFETKEHQFYGWHFFTYPAVVAPLRAVLDGRPDAFRAHQFLNLIVFSCALLSLLQLRRAPELFWAMTPLVFFTPVLWFLTFAHTESFVFSLGVSALTCHLAGRRLLAILFNSIAATQYQPLAPLSLFLCAEWLWLHRQDPLRARVGGALAAGLFAAIVFVPGAFYYYHYGVPNLIVRENLAAVRLISASKFGWMFVDPNGGMAFYTPGLLVLLIAVSVWAVRRAIRERTLWSVGLLGCALFTMFASTCQRNWNHPTFGVSRYVLYAIAPFLLAIGYELARGSWTKTRTAVVIAAVLLQAVANVEHGFFEYNGRDAAHHSDSARWILEHWPALYSPPPEIFCERTVGKCQTDVITGEPLSEYLPAIWQDSGGRARKILTHGCDPEKVLRARSWSEDEVRRIRASLQGCDSRGSVYIDL